ncbi:PqqD family protein [Nocardiopsis sp. LOL_012]|uniref:PqqD family protein n=1 Tax=Nocardiopsis sp. LOL_012 TaxID=3345409 RepID=UPI003A86B306
MTRVYPTRWAAAAIDPHGRGALILNLRTGTWTHLNPTAAAYWHTTIHHGLTHQQALTELADRYALAPAHLNADLAPLLEELRTQRLVQTEDSP